MRRGTFLVSTALVAVLSLSACDRIDPPAPVVNLGLQPESAAGVAMVSEGDTLWNISQRYRLPIRDIIDLNDLKPPYALPLGTRLKLPAPLDYTVKAGDSVHGVAAMFGASVSRLVQVNALPAPYQLHVGQVLRIPSRHAQAVEAAAAPPEEIMPEERPEAVEAESLPAPKSLPPAQPLVQPKPMPKAPAQTTVASSKRSDFIWPVQGKVISPYGPKDGGLFNDGINIVAPRGAPVAAAADGVVAYVGDDLKSYGNLVLIRHGSGMMTAYAHLGSLHVKRGMAVKKGQAIGTVGSTGAVSGAQLHFEIRNGAKTIDPRRYLG